MGPIDWNADDRTSTNCTTNTFTDGSNWSTSNGLDIRREMLSIGDAVTPPLDFPPMWWAPPIEHHKIAEGI